MPWRALTALVFGFSLACALAVPLGPSAQLAEAGALRIDSVLPAWLAPGATLEVDGFAGGKARLQLRAGGRVLARTTAGPLGRFRFALPAPKPGNYRLRIVSPGSVALVGMLLVRPVTLDAVGDVTFGEQVGPAVASHGAAYPWTGVAPTLRKADVTIGNLETSISRRGVAAVKEYTFRGPQQALPVMSRIAGFDVLTLANNHSVDYGPDALLDTVRFVRAAGIQPIGAGANAWLARRPAFVEAGGLRLAFLGYSDVNPPGFNAGGSSPGTARADSAAIDADVRAARATADVVVCFFHWGTEKVADPDSRQQQLAGACLNAGAQLVLGAHPHVLGPVGRPTVHTLVAWTLGNFVFPSAGEAARTAILDVRLDARGVRGYRLVPVRIDGFRPRLVAQD